jgi:hypothetical protein
MGAGSGEAREGDDGRASESPKQEALHPMAHHKPHHNERGQRRQPPTHVWEQEKKGVVV